MEFKLNQEQFEHILNMLILYKQMNPKKDVYLNEDSIKEALHFMNSIKSNLFNNSV